MRKVMLLLLFSLIVSAQTPYKETYDKPFFRGKYPQKTPFAIRPYPIHQEGTTYRVYFPARIAYSFVQFVREGEVYRGEVELEVRATDRETGVGRSRIWRASVSTPRFEDGYDEERSIFTVDSLDLTAGKYEILCKYRDLHGSQVLEYSRHLTIDPSGAVSYASPLLFDPLEAEESGTGPTRPSTSPLQQVWDFNRALGIHLRIDRDDTSKPVRARVDFLESTEGRMLFELDTLLHGEKDPLTLNLEIPETALEESQHRLKIVYHYDGDSTRVVQPIQVIWFEKPISLWDEMLSVKPLQYIVDEAAYRSVSGRKGAEQAAALREFWKERDPTPDTPFNELMREFYTRVDSTISLFSTRKMLGWETDPGRIYITYGPPHEIEDRSLAPIGEPYMRWIYKEGDRKYIYTFSAIDGRKEFRLTDSRQVDL